MMNFDEELLEEFKDNKNFFYSIADRWILSRLNTIVKEVTENIEEI